MARIPYVDLERVPDGDEALLKTSMDADDLPEAYRDLFSTEVRNVHRAIGNNLPVLRGFRQMNASLWRESGLTQRQRELVILAVAREVDSRYEWHQHVRHALSVGLTPAEITRIAHKEHGEFSDAEAALLAYSTVTAHGAVGEEHYAALADSFDSETVAGATMLAGAYAGLARALDALAVEPEEPFVGWDLEQL